MSTGGSDGDERSVTEQREACETVCRELGWQVTEVYEMVQSASRFARKERQRWIDLQGDIEAGRITGIVMWEPSRGSRDVTDWSGFLDRCRKAGAPVHIVIHERTYDVRRNADWKVLIGYGVDSASESNSTSDRVKRAIEANARAGRPHGLTYGYQHTHEHRKNRQMLSGQEPREPEASVVREIITRIGDGHALSRIVADLNGRGVPPPKAEKGSKCWYLSELRRIAVNPMYAARRKYVNRDGKTEILPGSWEPIVTWEEHLAAVRVIEERRTGKRRPGRYAWLMTGSGVCGACGGDDCQAACRGPRSAPRPAVAPRCAEVHDSPLRVAGHEYRCGRHGCRGVVIPVLDLDLWVEGLIVGRLCEEDVIGAFVNRDDRAAEAARIEEEELARRLDEHIKSAARGEMSGRALGIIEREREPQIEAARKRASELALPGALRAFSGVIGKIAAVHALWLTTPLAAQRDVIKALAEKIELMPRAAGDSMQDRVRVSWRENPGAIPAGSVSEKPSAEYVAPTWERAELVR